MNHPHNHVNALVVDNEIPVRRLCGNAYRISAGGASINPYDIDRTADRLHEAAVIGDDDATQRMRKLRRKIKRHDIYHWVNSYLNAIAGRDLADFPKIEDYVPGPPPTGQTRQA